MSTTAPPIDVAGPAAGPASAELRWDGSTVAQRAKLLRALPPLAQPIVQPQIADLSRLGWSAIPAPVRALVRVSLDPEGEVCKDDRIEIAAMLAIHQGYLYQCLTGRGEMTAALATRTERLTGLRRWRLRQTDWHEIWPDLVGLPGAPLPPAQEQNQTAAAA